MPIRQGYGGEKPEHVRKGEQEQVTQHPPAASDMLLLMHWEGYSVPPFEVAMKSTGLSDYKISKHYNKILY